MSLSRRNLIAGLAAALPMPAAALDLNGLGRPLGVQALAIRNPLIRDFPGTLRVLKAMDFGQIELVSFPGYIGNIRGDFAPLAKIPPRDIRRQMDDAGVPCRSCHFLDAEFEPANWSRTLDWAQGIGVRTMVFTGVDLPVTVTLGDLNGFFDKINAAGQKVRGAGLQMAVHSPAFLWRTIEGRVAMDEMKRQVVARDCMVQVDFASIVQANVDGAAMIARYADRILSLHLRDGKKPVDPDAYLPALPLGQGEVDWAAVMRAARAAHVQDYFVEMQLRPLTGVLDALKESCDFLRNLKA